MCHAYPLMSGAGLIANSTPLRYLSEAEHPEVVARLRGGGLIHARLDDFVGRSVAYFGDLDPKLRWVCKQVLRPGDVVIDVGANIGIVTLMAARLVGPAGQVHAVEPQTRLAAQIAASAALNRYANVTVHPIGLSDRAGTMTLTVPVDNAGAATLEGSVDGRSEIVRVDRTEDFLRAVSESPPRLLKLDVEGHEAAVIAGASAEFWAHGPDVIVLEELGKPSQDQLSIRTLEECGYWVMAIPKARLRTTLVPLAATAEAHDFVAVRRGRAGIDTLRRLGADLGYGGPRSLSGWLTRA